MALKLSLSPVDLHPVNPPETRPAQVAAWLDQALTRNAIEAARVIGDALAATNSVAVADARRLELAEKYWRTAEILWPRLELYFATAAHPLRGEPLDAAKATLFLAQELFVAYKRVLENAANKRALFGGNRDAGRAGASLHAMRLAHPRQQLSRLCSGPAANLARRAPDLRVRA